MLIIHTARFGMSDIFGLASWLRNELLVFLSRSFDAKLFGEIQNPTLPKSKKKAPAQLFLCFSGERYSKELGEGLFRCLH